MIVTYEDLYSEFDPTSLSFGATMPLAKQAVILNNAPAKDSYSGIITKLASLGLGAVYITDKTDTDARLPVQWSAFVDDVAVRSLCAIFGSLQ